MCAQLSYVPTNDVWFRSEKEEEKEPISPSDVIFFGPLTIIGATRTASQLNVFIVVIYDFA